MQHKVEQDSDRLDTFLSNLLSISRSQVLPSIKKGLVLVNNKIAKASNVLHQGDLISYPEILPMLNQNIISEAISLEIVYEDEHILIINKPCGMVTHPSVHQNSGTLVNALMAYSKSLSDINGKERLGIVHRLDKDTSGLIVAAKTNSAHQYMSELFQQRNINKNYIAISEGHFPDQKARISYPIEKFPEKSCMKVSSRGKAAITDVELLKQLKNHSLLSILIHTGRTHQIRVHLAYLGFPVCGDTIYGLRDTACTRLMLHAWKLSFVPYKSNQLMHFEAPWPQEFHDFIALEA
jgi:23S rRNA pseudouridine1911/1915/1917 synthase